MYPRLQFGLFAALTAIGITFSESNAANQSATVAVQTKGVQKAFNKSQHASIIAELHKAKRLLDISLHDYNGHRAHADHEIHHAIHLLEHGHHHKGEYKTNFTAKVHDGPIAGETQSQSDTNLRQAEKLVHAAHRQLEEWYTKHGHKHHQEAAHMLRKAAHEIEEALHVVRDYNEHHKKAVAAAAAAK